MSNAKTVAQQRTARRRSKLRFEMLNLFVDEGIVGAGLTAFEVATWLVLFRDTKPDGTATTSADDIARRTGISRRTVVQSLGRLRRAGMVQVVKAGGLNQGASSYAVRPNSSRK